MTSIYLDFNASTPIAPDVVAMGVAPEVGMGAVRFSLGRTTTEAEIEDTARRIAAAVGHAN